MFGTNTSANNYSAFGPAQFPGYPLAIGLIPFGFSGSCREWV